MKKAILPLILSNLIGGIASAIMVFIAQGDPIWIGALLTTLPIPFVLLIATNVFGLTRTSARLPVIQVMSVAGVALTCFTLLSRGIAAPLEYVALGLAIYGGECSLKDRFSYFKKAALEI